MKDKKNFKIHKDLEQYSDEWWKLRELRLTASHAQAIGNSGAGLDSYITEKMAEYFSSGDGKEYKNHHMERGNEREPIARGMYELETGYRVTEVGFVEVGEHVGCSPDGFVYDPENEESGLLEIKCPEDVVYYKIFKNGKKEVRSRYLWQVQMQLLVTGREWCDLVYYNPNYTQSLVKFRIKPKDEFQSKLKKGIKKGRKLIKEHLENYGGNKAEEIFG